jgi:hypothetical protein
MTHNLLNPAPKPPTVYFPIFSKSGSQMERKLGRGLPVRFFTPVKITVEVARLTPSPSREALRYWSFWVRV